MRNCENCTKSPAPINVPYVVHEAEMVRSERHIKRLWIALIVTICLFFAANAGWLYAWCQYDYESGTYEEISVDAQDGGNANYIGQDGYIYNGENNSAEDHTPQAQEAD